MTNDVHHFDLKLEVWPTGEMGMYLDTCKSGPAGFHVAKISGDKHEEVFKTRCEVMMIEFSLPASFTGEEAVFDTLEAHRVPKTWIANACRTLIEPNIIEATVEATIRLPSAA